jgi:cyclic pyranopterin phosphate synthase
MSVSLPMYEPKPSPVSRPTALHDSYGRAIRDLRVSVTDRCNFRCRYCMEPDVRFARKVHLLTDTEIVRVARIAKRLGVRRLRLTGGEPTVHPTLVELVRDLSSLGFDELSMTTNGTMASEAELARLRAAGLTRLTVSLDSQRPERFAALTRSTATPERVLETVRAAQRVGLAPVKVNAVVMRGFNDDEVSDLAGLARELGVDVRLIEYMPLDSGRRWDREAVVSAEEMLARIEATYPLADAGRERRSSPARSYAFADGAPGRVGVIASVTRPFCGACSRLRITADGKVMPCLFSRTEHDLRSLLRGGADDRAIVRFLADATWGKQSGRELDAPERLPSRAMNAIGG